MSQGTAENDKFSGYRTNGYQRESGGRSDNSFKVEVWCQNILLKTVVKIWMEIGKIYGKSDRGS